MKAYTGGPTVVGKTLDLSDFPVDTNCPFPSILLFSNVVAPYKSVGTAGGTRLAVPPFSIFFRPSDVFANSEDAMTRYKNKLPTLHLHVKVNPNGLANYQHTKREGTNGR
jgi:hypothetical protein